MDVSELECIFILLSLCRVTWIVWPISLVCSFKKFYIWSAWSAWNTCASIFITNKKLLDPCPYHAVVHIWIKCTFGRWISIISFRRKVFISVVFSCPIWVNYTLKNAQLLQWLQIPFCVVAGWAMGRPMDLNFQIFETATLFITVLVVAFMLQVSQWEFSFRLYF